MDTRALPRSMMTSVIMPAHMVRLITERIAELRKEIAQIQALNSQESKAVHYQEREAMKQRRADRLQEIMAELSTLTDWKKL
jgi:hypothetical protein